MEKLIEVTWFSSPFDTLENVGDAIGEYIRYDEDGKIVNEVVNVFLPEYVPAHLQALVKEQAIDTFHATL